jgi:alkanesulfonate monooxygenase SsuD/methylene tetrahydromethanopterin reductase-like flavin-dependent oxidoreductase (luciferase family)
VVVIVGCLPRFFQEYSGVDPFVCAALYLQATVRLTVALGVATIHARDPEAMVAAASMLHQAFPGRFALGLGASHRHLAENLGGSYARPLTAMRGYLATMDAAPGYGDGLAESCSCGGGTGSSTRTGI